MTCPRSTSVTIAACYLAGRNGPRWQPCVARWPSPCWLKPRLRSDHNHMIHRHLNPPKGTPPAQLGPAAIDDVLDRGDLEDWAPLARAVTDEPWGPLSDTVLRLCAAHPMYGTSRLWQAYVGACRAATLGRGGASWPTKPPVTTLPELRAARGMSQAAIGSHLGM